MSASDPRTPSAAAELPPRAELLAILALASGAFVMALNANVMAALLPYLREVPALRGGDSGDLVGAAGLAGAVGALLLGPTVDRFGRRPPMLLGMAVFSAASFAHTLAESFDQLLAARAVAGFAGGVVYSSASAAVADMVPYARRGRAMGLFTAGMFLGLPVGLPLAGVFAEAGHWEWVYYLQGGVGCFAFAAILAFLPAHLGKGGSFLANLPRLFRLEVCAALASVIFYVGAFFTAVQFAGTWLDQTGLLPKRDQWSVWLVLGVCSALGSTFLARIADRIGKRHWTNITCVVVAACLLALTAVSGIGGLLVVGIPLAVVSAARTGPFQALISDLVPVETRGTLMGLRSAAVNLGTGLFPVMATKVAGADYHTVLVIAAGGVFVAMLFVLVLVKKQ